MQTTLPKKVDLAFIRHAESMHNKAVTDLVEKHQLIYDWEHLSKNKLFMKEIKYNPKLIDCSITPQGRIQQCPRAVSELAKKGFVPDVILVSPLERTLQTCQAIFSQPGCPVIVEPLLIESNRSACDWICDVELKTKGYPGYNFDRIEEEGETWFLKEQSATNRVAYLNIWNQSAGQPYEVRIQYLLRYQSETLAYEQPETVQKRAEKIKDRLKIYKKSFSNIAIVSHFNAIRYTLAKQFNEKGEPEPQINIGNCQVIFESLNDL